MPDSPTPAASRKAVIIGWIIGVLPTPLLAFSAAGKFAMTPQVVEGFEHLGWPTKLAIPLAILELGAVVLYLIPRTAVLGAILFTGYMGGAIATHVRIGEAFIVQALLPVLFWLGLYLRDARLRALVPLRRPAS